MVRQTPLVIALEIFAGLLVLVAIAAVALFIRLSSGPIELGMFRDDVVRSISEARDGRRVEVGRVSLEWLRSERRVVILARDLELYDDAGAVAAEAKTTELLVNASGLLSGDLQPIGLVLSGGRVDVRRSASGWTIAGDPVGEIAMPDEPAEQDAPVRALVEQANAVLVDLFDVLRNSAITADLETLRFEAVNIQFIDDVRGSEASLRNAEGQIVRGRDGLSARVAGASDFGDDGPGTFRVDMDLPPDYSQLTASFGLDDWSLASVMEFVPVSGVKVSDVPASVSLNFLITEADGLSEVDVELEVGSGTISTGTRDWPVAAISTTGHYTLASDQLVLEVPELSVGPIETGGTLEMDNLLQSDGPRPFRLELPDLDLDLRPIFSAPWPARGLRASGTAWPQDFRMALDRLSITTGKANIIANGELQLLTDLKPGDVPIKGRFAAEMSGELPHDEFLKFWPVRQGAGARNYVDQNVIEGMVTEAAFVFDFDRDSRAKGYLEDEAINGTFSVSGVSLRPLRDIPPIINTSLTGRMTGNSTRLDFSGGRLALWQIETGFVHYPQLSPPGADMMVSVTGTGPARNMVQILSDSRLRLQERTGIDPASVSGDANLTFSLARPALPDTPISTYRYSAEGPILDGGLKGVAGGFDLIDSDARIDLDQNGVRIFGFGSLAGVPLQYDWSNGFGDGGEPGRLEANGIITPSGLNEIGVPARAYLSGEAPVQLTAELDGSRLEDVSAAIDFTTARLDVSEVGWIKSPGDPATLTIDFSQGDNDTLDIVTDFEARTAGLSADLTIETTGRLVSADISRAFLEDRADVSGTARRGDENALIFNVNGKFLDLSELVGSMLQVGAGGRSAAARVGTV
ncbi:MAG: DUF3971 domain-containing protein, partial [Pseudomonadota bacterium]